MKLKEGMELNVVRRTKKADIKMDKLTEEELNSTPFLLIRRIGLKHGAKYNTNDSDFDGSFR